MQSFNYRYLVAFITNIIVCLLLNGNVYAQSSTYKRTPAALAPGTPVGSYALNDLETVNLSNGNLNFSLPLLQIGGRGNAGYAMNLPIEHKWQINRVNDDLGNDFYYPQYEWWNPMKPGFSPGIVTARQTSTECANPGGSTITSTNLTFTSVNGTEIELKDTVAYGTDQDSICQYNYPANGKLRGNIFVSRDGSHMTFVSDSTIYDLISSNVTVPHILSPSGYLMFKDGTKYRIDNGFVSWISDRNGNKISFTYNSGKVSSVIDSLNRQLTFEYNVNEGDPYGICDKIIYKGINGATRTIRISKESLSSVLKSGETLKTEAQLFPNLQGGTTIVNPANLVSSVWLPDGRRYQFFYNSYADLARVILPTGGAIEYDWWGSDLYNTIVRRLTERRIYPDGTNLESKTVYDVPPINSNSITVRQKSASNQQLSVTKHYFLGDREIKVESYLSDGSTLLQETVNTWQEDSSAPWFEGNPRITETTTKLVETNQISKQTFDYDQFNNITDTYEYDYGIGQPGALKRRTHSDYVTAASYISHTGAHLRSLPLQTWISSDVAGNYKASLTQFEYDGYIGANRAQLLDRTNVTGHNVTNYGSSNTIRGNLTKVTTYSNAQTQIESISVYSHYDILGNVVATIDGKGNLSTISYNDNFGSPDGEARTNTLPTQLNGQSTFAFPTSATNALNWITGYSQVDYYTGQVVDVEDLNGIVNSTFYNDPLDRPTRMIVGNNQPAFKQQTNVIYDDLNRRIETKSDLNIFNDNLLKSESFYDGLGRNVENRKYESDGGYVVTKSIPVTVMQDAETGIWRTTAKASNPYRPLQNEQPVWTTALSDEFGRGIKTITPDGAVVKIQYTGNATTVIDQAGKKRRSIVNALGWLVRVDEPADTGELGTIANPTQPTNYKYNALGKMIEATQGVQQRFFLYDSLGRLLRVRQPEQQINPVLNLSNSETANTQWTVGFSYDANSNLLATTDAKNVTTSVTYDQLNRVSARSYSDGVTPSVSYTYDDPNVPFSKGKLTKIGSTISETRFTIYDIIGRLAASEQRTPFGAETVSQSIPRTSKYKYNLAGILTEQTYPSDRIVKNFLEADGDLSSISSKAINGQFKTYASNFAYTASGVIKHLQIGNGLWESAKLNSRDQVTELNLGNSPTDGSLWKLNYHYGELNPNGSVDSTKNAGNIVKQTVSFAGLAQPFVQTYKYDSLDRIKEAKEMSGTNQIWTQNWSYDRYGNRTQFSQNVLGQQMAINNQTLPTVDQNTNRIQMGQGYQYDANGNLIVDAAGRQFTFDGDNKQTLVRDASNKIVGRYYYDGNGRRVRKETNTETTIFVYDGMGKLVAEYSTATPVQNPTVNYTATDPIGSPRVLTNSRKEIVSRRDFMPFGEEIAPDPTYRTANLKYGALDNVRQKFTGYQRDEETNLDFAEARYYNTDHGRFTAVDPLLASGKSADPQTFNRYAYTMNRPLILTDTTGLQAGQKSGTQQDLIPLPQVLLDIATMETRSTTDGMIFYLTPGEIKQRVELATLAYNEGFKQGERDAQEYLGQTVEVNSVESVDSSSREKSNESSSETGISVSPKDVGISQKQTDKTGEKDTKNGSHKVGATVKSGISESVAGTKDLAKARQTVVNEQSSKVRDVIDKNDQPAKAKVDVAPSIDDLVKKSSTLGNGDGYNSYLRSNLIKQE